MAAQAKEGPAKRGPVGKILLVAFGLYQAVFVAWILIALIFATLPASEGAAGGGPGIERIGMLVFFWAAGSLLLWYAVKKEEKVRAQLAK
jgi:hypothetical protein